MRDGYVFYKSFYEAMKELDIETKCQILDAICEYQFNEIEIELSGTQKAIWKLIKPQLDANNQRYENGKKGGRPKTIGYEDEKPNNNQTKPMVFNNKTIGYEIENQTEPKEKVKDKVKVKVKDKENVKEKVKEEEKEKENLDLLLPPPSLSQVLDYVKEKELKCDGKHFFDYYEASGWIDKDGNVISNWKQKLLNWSKKEYDAEAKEDGNKFRSGDVIDFDQYYANLRDD